MLPRNKLVPSLASILFIAPLAWSAAPSDEAVQLTPEQLVAVEKLRPKVEPLLAQLRDPATNPVPREERFETAVRQLAALGPDVVPFLVAELDLPDTATFHIAAYTLGLINDPGGDAALRRAADVANREGGAYGLARKKWAVYGLAMRGQADAVDIAVADPTPVDWPEHIAEYRMLEVVAALTAPASVPKLVEHLRQWDADEAKHDRLDVALMALGATGDKSAVPALIPFLKHKRVRVRAQAARSLGRIGDPAAIEPLFAALKDPETGVQIEAAIGLQAMRPTARFQDFLAALETAEDVDVRGRLYRTIAAIGGESTLEVLRANARRSSGLERTLIAAAVGELGSRKGLNLLRANLADSDVNVLLTSIRSIAEIGGEGAEDTLVALVADSRPPVAQTAIEISGESGVTRAAPRIAERLLNDYLSAPVRDSGVRTLVEKSCESLVRLRYAEPRADLRAAAAKEPNPEIAAGILATATLLDAIATKGNDDAKWIDALNNGDPALRSLAASRLSEIATSRGAAALAAAYAKPDSPAEELLVALAKSRAASSQSALLEKIVSDPAWDVWRRHGERAWAAWGLRRIGGEKSEATLKASAERRGGADWPVLAYYAQLAGPESLTTLRRSRAQRLRDFTWLRGEEQGQLERMIVSVEAGHPIDAYDIPPDRLLEH